jgi:hypothetical protein
MAIKESAHGALALFYMSRSGDLGDLTLAALEKSPQNVAEKEKFGASHPIVLYERVVRGMQVLR